MTALAIPVTTLMQMGQALRAREAAHVQRSYTIEVTPFGLTLRVVDRTRAHACTYTRLLCLDALALAQVSYVTHVLDEADARLSRTLDSLGVSAREAA